MRPVPTAEQTVAALRRMAGNETPRHRQIEHVCEATEALAAGTRGWRMFAPRPAVLDSAIVQADAVARAMRELRAAMREGRADG